MVVQMMAVGEETGALDTMIFKVADFYDQEVEAAVASLTRMIEPILIAVMGAAVGGMVIALYWMNTSSIQVVVQETVHSPYSSSRWTSRSRSTG